MRQLLIIGVVLGAPLAMWAQERTLQFEPARTEIHWTLDTVLHTVHGTFQLRSGTVRYNASTGQAAGELIVDAHSGQSGSGARDGRMHASILQSNQYPEIIFRPDHVNGTAPEQGDATLQVHGQFVLHGQTREMTLPVQVHADASGVTARSQFAIEYLKWGLKNPSTFILRCSDHVNIDLTAYAHGAAERGK